MTNEVKLINLLKSIKDARGIKGDVFFPVSMETLADGIGCSKKTIYNTISRLECKGYIETEKGDRNEGIPKKYKINKIMDEDMLTGNKFKTRIKVGDIEFDAVVSSNDEVIDIINRMKGDSVQVQRTPPIKQSVVPNAANTKFKDGSTKVDAVVNYIKNLEAEVEPLIKQVKATNDKEIAKKAVEIIEDNKVKEPWKRVDKVIKDYEETLTPKQVRFLKVKAKEIEEWFKNREETVDNLNKFINKHNY